MSDLIKEDLQTLQMIYSIYKSDELLINGLFDSEIYELDIIYDEFFDIFKNMRISNLLKTSYRFKKLLKSAEKNLNTFIKRHPKIKNKFIKKDPETGTEFLEF